MRRDHSRIGAAMTTGMNRANNTGGTLPAALKKPLIAALHTTASHVALRSDAVSLARSSPSHSPIKT
jgi:hypothetical protein